jgi:hypothetical protein
MMLDPIMVQWILGLLAALLIAGIGYILKTLNAQNTAMAGHSQALAVLVTRVDPALQKTASLEASVNDLTNRVFRLEITGGLTPAPQAPQTVTVNA